MEILNNVSKVREIVKGWKAEGLKVGLVPTMGYLHEGHESLIKRAVSENDRVVVSVFVNPTQFGPNEDLDKYPRDLERDSKLCENAGASLIFHPEIEDMYYKDASTFIEVEGPTTGLCGSSRPTHFRGVCTVVSKLFNIVPANRAYFGEKDAQQLAVIKRMVRHLNFDIEIVGCPIVREEDGLAKSSRNTYLSVEERKAALVLNKSLSMAKNIMDAGERNADNIKKLIKENIENEELSKIDYIEVVSSNTLESVHEIEEDVLVALAVYFGKTRLIDNFTYHI
ncbi:MAG TPA: pantoate--beta-alanine ligase [Clostridium sp.]|nr:pantoate--beta-alanine ligase [Clostridium sp.]